MHETNESPIASDVVPKKDGGEPHGSNSCSGVALWVGDEKGFEPHRGALIKNFPQLEWVTLHSIETFVSSPDKLDRNIKCVMVNCEDEKDAAGLLNFLHDFPGNNRPPICLLLTENLLKHVKTTGLTFKAVDFLFKPYCETTLVWRMKSILERSEVHNREALALGLNHIKDLVATRDRMRSVAITLSYILNVLGSTSSGCDVKCWFFKGLAQNLESVSLFRLIKPNTEPHTKKQVVTPYHAMVRFKQLKSNESNYDGPLLETFLLKDGVLLIPVVREDYLRAIISLSQVGLEGPLSHQDIEILSGLIGALSLSLETIDIYGELLVLEKKIGRTRLEELGNMAIKLGDRLNTPLNVLTLVLEELTEFEMENSLLQSLIPTAQNAVDKMRLELKGLSKFKEFADKEILDKDVFK